MNIPFAIPDGYRAVCIVRMFATSGSVIVENAYFNNDMKTIAVAVSNLNGAQQHVNVFISILFEKTD